MGFDVRLATREDYPVFARLFPELGVADPLPDADAFATGMLPRVIILEADGESLGYALWQVYGAVAHVVHVVVDPRARGRRAGEALLAEVKARALGEGCARWFLNVKQDNASALRLYERVGFARVLEGWSVETTWEALATMPGEGGGATVRPLEPSDDAEAAARFDVDAERIAQLRGRRGEVLLQVREAGALVAFAGFAPAYPGVFPVRVARAELARALFDGLRPHATAPRLHVFVEGNRPLYELLVASGARLEHALFRMEARLA